MTASDIRKARRSNIFADLNVPERVDVIRDALHRAYLLRGLEPPEDELDIPVQEIENKINYTYPGLAVDELPLAFEAGVSGDFGGERKMVVANYFYWLASYVNSSVRQDVLRDEARRPSSDYEGYRLSSDEINRRNAQAERNGALRLYNEVRLTGEMDVLLSGYAAMVYDGLVRRGKINPTPETLAEAKKRAQLRSRRNIFDRALTPEGDIAYEVKQELLLMYFRHLASNNIDLKI